MTFVDVPAYTSAGLHLHWDDDAAILATADGARVEILANRSGLVTLARHLLTLAQETVPVGHHIELDELNGLEQSSIEVSVRLVDDVDPRRGED